MRDDHPLEGIGIAAVRVHHQDHDDLLVQVMDTQAKADDAMRTDGEKAINQGHRVTWPDGSQEWVNVGAVFDPVSKGDVWHEDGERILCERTRVTVAKDGKRTERKLRRTWRLERVVYGD